MSHAPNNTTAPSVGATTETAGQASALAPATCSALRYERTLFVLSKGGHILCLSPDQGAAMKALMAESWKHTATIDPALWIKSLIEANADHASDMMDELNFGPNASHEP